MEQDDLEWNRINEQDRIIRVVAEKGNGLQYSISKKNQAIIKYTEEYNFNYYDLNNDGRLVG